MDWVATLRRSGGVNALARQIGVSPVEATAGVEALLPCLLGGFREVGNSEAGLPGLLARLAMLGDGNLAAEILGPGPLATQPGETILGWLLPDKAARDAAVAQAVAASGIDPQVAERLLPPLAMLVGGYISARADAIGDAKGLEGILDDNDRI